MRYTICELEAFSVIGQKVELGLSKTAETLEDYFLKATGEVGK